MAETRAWRVKWDGITGIYWAATRGKARAEAWRGFSDVFDTRTYGFREFVRDLTVHRAPESDGAFRGRQGLLPEYVLATTEQETPDA